MALWGFSMGRPKKAVCLCLLALALPALGLTLEGVVLRDDTGTPLVSAELSVAREGDRLLAAQLETDRAGRFRAEDLPEGNYTLTVSKGGYLDTAFAFSLEAMPIQIRLIRTASIAGRAQWSDGRPLEQARVYLMERSKSGNLREFRLASAYAATKSDGGFRLHGLPPGNYVLAMSFQSSEHSGGSLYPDAADPKVFSIKGGEEIRDCNFIADAGASSSISGKLDIPPPAPAPLPPVATSPASGASPQPTQVYSVGLAPSRQPGVLIAWVKTAADGSFEMPAVPWGEYEVYAAGPVIGFSGRGSFLAREGDLLFGRSRIQVGARVDNLRVPLSPARSAALRLEPAKQGRGACPASLDVRLAALEAWGADLSRTVTLSFGKVQTVDKLAPARYEVTAARQLPGCGFLSAPVLDLRDAAPADPIALVVGGMGSSIAGKVVDLAPGASLEVVLLPLRGAASGAISILPVNSLGEFRSQNLEPGRYGLAVRSRAGGNSARLLLDPESLIEVEVLGGEVEIQLNSPAVGATADAPKE